MISAVWSLSKFYKAISTEIGHLYPMIRKSKLMVSLTLIQTKENCFDETIFFTDDKETKGANNISQP